LMVVLLSVSEKVGEDRIVPRLHACRHTIRWVDVSPPHCKPGDACDVIRMADFMVSGKSVGRCHPSVLVAESMVQSDHRAFACHPINKRCQSSLGPTVVSGTCDAIGTQRKLGLSVIIP
jgi:hypothetical protein